MLRREGSDESVYRPERGYCRHRSRLLSAAAARHLKADGTPAEPLISWQDARSPGLMSIPILTWPRSPFSGYLSHRLTGEFKDNIANYFGQWPVDYKTWGERHDEVVKAV